MPAHLPLILKVNETFVLLSPFGQISGNREADRDTTFSGPLHPFISAEGLYRNDTRFLDQYLWHWPDFYMASQEIKDTRLLIQQWALMEDLVQRMGLSRRLELSETGILDQLVFENTSFSEETLILRLMLREGFQDVLSVRGWQPMGTPRRIVREETESGCNFIYTGEDLRESRMKVIWDRPQEEGRFPEAGIWRVRLAPQSRWQLSVQIQLEEPPPMQFPSPSRHNAVRESHHEIPTAAEWEKHFSKIKIHPHDSRTWKQNLEDLRALLLKTPQGLFPAAGLPWYGDPYARDGLWTSHMLMPFIPEIGEDVLRFLASNQGTRDDPLPEEEPGKILHYMRKGELSRVGMLPLLKNYGSVDSTPLFIAMLEDHWNCTGNLSLVRELRPHWEAALDWITRHRHPETGMLTFSPGGSGLAMQSWKESGDQMTHTDGRLAHPPLALSEMQGYAFRAFHAAARFYSALHEMEKAKYWDNEKSAFKHNFHEWFWVDENRTYAIALDFHAQRLEVQSSDPGQLLWSGIVPDTVAESLVETLFSEKLWSGWGIRSLGIREARYSPMAQFNGAVWIHDTAILAGGLSRYGFDERVEQVRQALFELARMQPDGRVPQIIGGHARGSVPPSPLPTACRPQSWSAASLVYLMRLKQHPLNDFP